MGYIIIFLVCEVNNKNIALKCANKILSVLDINIKENLTAYCNWL